MCVLLPGVVYRSELTSEYTLQLAIVFMSPWENMFLPYVDGPWDYILLMWLLLKPQNINCLTLWIRLAMAWDFSPAHFWFRSPRSHCIQSSKQVSICFFQKLSSPYCPLYPSLPPPPHLIFPFYVPLYLSITPYFICPFLGDLHTPQSLTRYRTSVVIWIVAYISKA